MTLMKLRLGFLITDLFQHFGIYVVAFSLKYLFIDNRRLKIILSRLFTYQKWKQY